MELVLYSSSIFNISNLLLNSSFGTLKKIVTISSDIDGPSWLSNSLYAFVFIEIVLFAGIRERLELADIPEAFKGFPITLISASLMSIAFLGFTGLIKL